MDSKKRVQHRKNMTLAVLQFEACCIYPCLSLLAYQQIAHPGLYKKKNAQTPSPDANSKNRTERSKHGLKYLFLRLLLDVAGPWFGRKLIAIDNVP